jgi:hypothetical protein
MVLTVSFVLSPVTGLVCHRHRRNCLRQLDASVGASGPHDFAVREPAPFVCAPPRPPHPAPYVRDDRETPLCLGRDDSLYSCFYQTGKRKILREGTGHPNCRTARRANHMRTHQPKRVRARRRPMTGSRSNPEMARRRKNGLLRRLRSSSAVSSALPQG